MRIGDDKAIRFLNLKNKDAGHTIIYNLKTDPDETKDISAKHQYLVKKAKAIMAPRKNPLHEP
ncbi:MAG: hypothetical protein ACKVQS_01035 [Fimbriimonadaceae bacterium]